jgi:hypothetical protein
MQQAAISFSDDLLLSLNMSVGEVVSSMRKEYATKMYQQGKLTLGQGAEFCGMCLYDFTALQHRRSMVVVCDSAPLFALAVCGQLDLLEKICDEVLIPEAVYQEAIVPGKPYADKLGEWAQGKVVEITDIELCRSIKLSLHKGEAEAITLYKEKSADLLLIDEKKCRKVAEYYD